MGAQQKELQGIYKALTGQWEKERRNENRGNGNTKTKTTVQSKSILWETFTYRN